MLERSKKLKMLERSKKLKMLERSKKLKMLERSKKLKMLERSKKLRLINKSRFINNRIETNIKNDIKLKLEEYDPEEDIETEMEKSDHDNISTNYDKINNQGNSPTSVSSFEYLKDKKYNFMLSESYLFANPLCRVFADFVNLLKK
jgi:hypothetical protein